MEPFTSSLIFHNKNKYIFDTKKKIFCLRNLDQFIYLGENHCHVKHNNFVAFSFVHIFSWKHSHDVNLKYFEKLIILP